jgi:hypothetical protein
MRNRLNTHTKHRHMLAFQIPNLRREVPCRESSTATRLVDHDRKPAASTMAISCRSALSAWGVRGFENRHQWITYELK